MSDKLSEGKDSIIEFLKKSWIPFVGFFGAFTLAYNFYQLWLGDRATITYFLTGGGLFVLLVALGWIGLAQKTIIEKSNLFQANSWAIESKSKKVPVYTHFYRVAQISFIVVLGGTLFGVNVLVDKARKQTVQFAQQSIATQQAIRAREDLLIVLVAAFDAPEDMYGLQDAIIKKLNDDFVNDDKVKIETLNEIIAPGNDSGSIRARELGTIYQADIVIWGWYRPNENPNIAIHVENLSPGQLFTVDAGDLEHAMADYNQAIQLDPRDSSFYFNRGNTYAHSGDLEHAIADYSQAIQLDPRDWLSYFNRGIAYSDSGDLERAIADYSQAIKLNPQDADTYFNRGVAYANSGDLEHAIADYSQAIKFKPEDADTYFNRGIAYSDSGDLERAIADYSQAIELDPQYIDAYTNRGNIYTRSGDLERAIADYSQAIELDPQDTYAYNNRGVAYADSGDLERAIADYSQAIELDPQYIDAYTNRGNIYADSGDLEHAIADYSQAIELDPQDAYAYYNRGYAYKDLGEYTKAMKDYEKTTLLNPNDPSLLNNVAYDMALMDINLQKALEYINKSLELRPDDPDSLDTQGYIYYKLGDYKKALEIFTYAIEKKEQAYSYYGRGLVYEAIGENEKAINDLKLFLTQYPDDSLSEDARKHLESLDVKP